MSAPFRMFEIELDSPAFVIALLRELSGERTTHVWFIGGIRVESEDWNRLALPDPDDYMVINAFADLMYINGVVSIVKIADREDDVLQACYLEDYARLLGQGDIVRGVATSRQTLGETLKHLTLAEPVPVADGKSSLGLSSLEPLSRLVAAGDLFYEEAEEGTRLRIADSALTDERLVAAIGRAREGLRPEGK